MTSCRGRSWYGSSVASSGWAPWADEPQAARLSSLRRCHAAATLPSGGWLPPSAAPAAESGTADGGGGGSGAPATISGVSATTGAAAAAAAAASYWRAVHALP
jgi:hypothetical protein